MTRRRGTSLVELIVALALTALICALVAGPIVAVERWARRQADRLAIAETLRLPVFALRSELRSLRPDADIAAIAGDSIALRAFRGTGLVCGTDDGRPLVRYRGARRPNPEKDSVIVVAAGGVGTGSELRASTPAPDACPARPDETVMRWTVDASVARGTLLLLFERGSYHLADRAFRFRRGLSGRQPLTAERLAGESGLRALDVAGLATDRSDSAVAVGLTLVPTPDPDLRVDATGLDTVAVRLPLLNGLAATRPPADTAGARR